MRHALLFLALALAACGSSSSQSDAKVFLDAPGGPAITVKNYLSWCTVKINNGTGSTAAVLTMPVTAGAVPVSATANTPTFVLAANMWHHTDGDTGGAGDSGTVTGGSLTTPGASSAVTVTVGATGKCVWLCCPFANGTGCPTADQCP